MGDVELLVRNFDGTGGRSKGDIVSAKPAPFKWGKGEGLPNYSIITVKGVDISTIEAFYCQRHKPVEWDLLTGEAIKKVRSFYKVNIDIFSAKSKALLQTGGAMDIKYDSLKSVVLDRTKK